MHDGPDLIARYRAARARNEIIDAATIAGIKYVFDRRFNTRARKSSPIGRSRAIFLGLRGYARIEKPA